MTELQTENLERIANEYGTSVYLFDCNAFARNFIDLQNAFKSYYPNTMIAYSYKTNYATAICAIVKDLGGLAEVVSPMEYYHATRNVGNSDKDIILNGVCKDDDLRAKLAVSGAIVNIDSVQEFERLSARLSVNSNAKLGIRVMVDPQNSSRFGMTADEILQAVKLAKKYNVPIAGLHCHTSGKRNADAWRYKVTKMLDVAREVAMSFPIEYIDLGGHMYGNMDKRLEAQFHESVPDFGEYAEVVAKAFADEFGENGPKLILEPGIALVTDTVSCLTSVTGIKERSPKSIATLDVSCYDCGYNPKNLPIDVVSATKQLAKRYKLCGYTYMEADDINRDYVGSLEYGDIALIRNVGAYTNVLKPPFIMPSISMLQVNSDFEAIKIIKKAESYDDIFGAYEVR